MRKIAIIILVFVTCLSAVAQDVATREQVLEQLKWAEENFYDVQSENYDEEKFIAEVTSLLTSPVLTATDRYRPEMLLAEAKKNRAGAIAANIDGVTASGANVSLQSIKADYMLLFFNDPDCEDCAEIKGEIKRSQEIKDAIKAGRLAIVGIYPFDDEEAWRQASYPEIMINLWDKSQQVIEEERYVLKAVPSLYLLDSQKRVVKKNCTLAQVLQLLAQ